MTIIKNAPTDDLSTTILAGINAHRFLPEAGSYPEAERVRLEQGASDRIDAKQALRQLTEELQASRAALIAINDLASCRLREALHADANWIHDMREIARLSEAP